MLHALNKDSGQVLWVSQLNFPMIGSFEYDNQKVSDNIFIPLIDGNLIRFDKEGFLEVREHHLITHDVEDSIQRQRLGLC
jgi:hypothetical protein